MQKARRGIFGEASDEGRRWVDELMHTYKHDGYAAAWDRLTTLRGSLVDKEKFSAIDRLMQYGAERHDIFRYPEFLAQGWQIGGPTEPECKTTQRVKGRGRRWNSSNAEAMMALSALDESGRWHQRWETPGTSRN